MNHTKYAIFFVAMMAVVWLSCAPNPREEFDASCGNDLECMGWYVTDICDDDLDTTYAFFTIGKPQKTWGPYYTPALGEYATGLLKCVRDEQVCIGAKAGDDSWGLGLEGDKSCEKCCGVCNGMSFNFDLSCPAKSSGDDKFIP